MTFRTIVLVGFIAVALVGASTSAQTAAPAAKPPAELKFDPKDLTGVWQRTRQGGPFGKGGHAGGDEYPLTPEYKAILKERQAAEAAGHPFDKAGSTCLPGGLAAMATLSGYPIEIFYQKGGKEILVQKENVGEIYRIYLNKPHKPAEDLYPMFYGDSVGHWEGNILVVDSISLGASRALDLVTPHSDALHIVQRFRRVSYDTMEDVITLDDPKAFTHPITGTATYKSHPELEMAEYECTNERFQTDANGNHTLVPSPK